MLPVPKNGGALPRYRYARKLLGFGDAADLIVTMKLQIAASPTKAFNRTELFVVIGVVVVLIGMLGAVLVPGSSLLKSKVKAIKCVQNVSYIWAAFSVWGGNNDDKFPMQFALTNSETMKLISSGSAYVLWQIMSNEFASPRDLHCPADAEHVPATNFTTGFRDVNISYFFNLDAIDAHPQTILSGDDNLVVNDVRVKPGILNLLAKGPLSWTKERHRGIGIMGMADGSVLQTTPTKLNAAVINATNRTPGTTYRWVIP